jgi:hypothetical protein
LQAAIDAVELLFTELFDILIAIIFPATPTAVSTLAAFAIIFPLVLVVLGFLFRLVRRGGSD